MKNIISDVYVTIYAKKVDDTLNNERNLEKRENILTSLGLPLTAPKSNDDFWLFYEEYSFPKSEYNRIKTIAETFHKAFGRWSAAGTEFDVDCFYDFEEVDTIELSTEVRVSDPCYNMDTWCAGTLKDVLPGTYRCFYQLTDEGRVASIKVVHSDYDPNECEPNEGQEIDVGVDSGMCGIYDLPYFEENCTNEDWYDIISEVNDAEAFEDKAFVSSSGYGDGSYDCYVSKNSDGKIIAIKIVYIELGEEEE